MRGKCNHREGLLGFIVLAAITFSGTSTLEAQVKVTNEFSIDSKKVDVENDELGSAEIGSTITAKLEGGEPASFANIVPFINGIPLKGVKVVPDGNGNIRFNLEMNERTKKTWKEILEVRSLRSTLSIGPEDGKPYPSAIDESNFEIGVLPSRGWIFFVSIVALIFSFFGYLAGKTAILRADAGDGETPMYKRKWSLARVQWGGWICIIAACFFLVWLITGEVAVNDTALVLLGISTATIFGSKMVGDPQRTAEGEKALAPMLGKTKVGDERVKNKILKFGHDLVTDPNGEHSLNRFQMMLFTALLWGIYIWTVFTTWSLPEYNSKLLLLMGISSSAFVGFKAQGAQGKSDSER